MMDIKEFKAHYVCTFLATYAAIHYDNACAMDQHYRLVKHLAVEDSQHLADRAWEQLNTNAELSTGIPSAPNSCSAGGNGMQKGNQ